VLVLGDLVGYGADPNGVVDRVRALSPLAMVRGNHDKVASGIEDAEGFNQVARSAARWTFETLRPENREYLAALPIGPTVVDDLIEICHGSPFDEDAYIFDELDALRALKAAGRPLCLFGHTHLPVAYVLSDGGLEASGPAPGTESVVALVEGARYLINPGSVGQPRDGDPRAAYAIVDAGTRRILLYRVAYAVEEAQAKVVKAGLPETLAHRLALGR